jgi:hypothetical protein
MYDFPDTDPQIVAEGQINNLWVAGVDLAVEKSGVFTPETVLYGHVCAAVTYYEDFKAALAELGSIEAPFHADLAEALDALADSLDGQIKAAPPGTYDDTISLRGCTDLDFVRLYVHQWRSAAAEHRTLAGLAPADAA